MCFSLIELSDRFGTVRLNLLQLSCLYISTFVKTFFSLKLLFARVSCHVIFYLEICRLVSNIIMVFFHILKNGPTFGIKKMKIAFLHVLFFSN